MAWGGPWIPGVGRAVKFISGLLTEQKKDRMDSGKFIMDFVALVAARFGP